MATEWTLSLRELCFAILVESHKIASRCLFEFAFNAVKACSPEEWIEALCACFGVGVARYARERLENDLPLTDIYVVCRIIRCRINDIATYCGGSLLNPSAKERFSLQIQGVETARHWAFHGEKYVSPGEVRSNIQCLLSVLKTLSAYRKTKSINVSEDHLGRLLEYAESLQNPTPDSEYLMRPTSIGDALLYRSFTEFEVNYNKFFDEVMTANGCCFSMARAGLNGQTGDFPTFIKGVRKAIQQPGKCPKLRWPFGLNCEKFDCVAMCKNVLALRNAWAHSGEITLSRRNEALLDVNNLLCIFGLSHEQTTSALKGIASMREKDSPREDSLCYCTLQEDDTLLVESSKRILRPRGQHFIGRESELLSVKSVLTKEWRRDNQAVHVLVYGQPGVGKSYFATEVVHNITKTYSKQAWLSCSTKHDLELDLSLSKTVNSPISMSAYEHTNKTVAMEATYERHHCECDPQLLVLDDVRSSTMQYVYDLVTRRGASTIITTRSTAVKKFFFTMLPSLHVLHLRPFSISDSWSLAERRVKLGDVEADLIPLIRKTISSVLGNLPLCVSIYSSLLAKTLRKTDQGVKCKHARGLAPVEWKEIEEHFGDHLHVRGLTGIVKCAESYLQDSPLTVYLLAKICFADSESIPWEILCKRDPQGIRLHFGQKGHAVSFESLLSSLLGVTDWLFSPRGQGTLEICRNTLEEFGIISWEDSTSTVCIHMMTRESVREMLELTHLFLGNLFSQITFDSQKVNSLTKKVSVFLSGELELQMLARCVQILKEAVSAIGEIYPKEVAYSVFEFLSNFVEKSTLASLGEMLTNEQLGLVRSELAHALFKFQRKCFLQGRKEDVLSWIQWCRQFPIYKDELWKMVVVYFGKEVNDFYYKGMDRKTQLNLNAFLKVAEYCQGESSLIAALIHCLVAAITERTEGSLARELYMKRVSNRCPHLISEPTDKDLLSAICDTLKSSCYNRLHDKQHSMKYFIWYHLLRFQTKPLQEIDAEKLKTILLFMILSQQRQCLIIQGISALCSQENQRSSKTLTLNCSHLMGEARSEISLWHIMGKGGRALRVLMKTYQVIDGTCIISQANASRQRVGQEFWCNLWELVGGICLTLRQAGHLSHVTKIFSNILPKEREHSGKKNIDHDMARENIASTQKISSAEYTVDNEFYALQVVIKLFRELRIMKECWDFRRVLDRLVTVMGGLFALKGNYRFVQLNSDVFLRAAIGFVECLSNMLGRRRSLNSFSQLVTLSKKSTISMHWRIILKNVVDRIIANWDKDQLHPIYDSFVQSRNDFAQGRFMQSHKEALKCLKKLVQIQAEEASITEDGSHVKFFKMETFTFMVFELAQILQSLYGMKMMFTSAGWFATFRIKLATKAGFFLLAAQYKMEYIDFLTERKDYREALEQCQTVQRDLEEDLGDDYLEWLPAMPDMAMIRTEIEKLAHDC